MNYRTSKTAHEYLLKGKKYSIDELLDLRLKYTNRIGLGVNIPDCFYEMEIKDIDKILNKDG